jgi:hypothetical protein
MQRRVHMARVGIALIAFANATAALTVPKAFAHAATGGPVTVQAMPDGGSQVRVQRLPRVPRRERFEGDAMAVSAAWADE